MTTDVPGWALDLLREARVARLGTASAAAQPLVVPVCFAFDGAGFYTAIDAKPKRTRALRRLRHIEENPQVSLVVDHYEEDWQALRWVMAEGRADILTAGADFADGIDRLRAKYPQYRAMNLSREAGTLIRIAPTRWAVWRFA